MHAIERQLYEAVHRRDMVQVKSLMGAVLALFGETIHGEYITVNGASGIDNLIPVATWLHQYHDHRDLTYVVRGTRSLIIALHRAPHGRWIQLMPVGRDDKETAFMAESFIQKGFLLGKIMENNRIVTEMQPAKAAPTGLERKMTRRNQVRVITGAIAFIGFCIMMAALTLSWPVAIAWFGGALMLPNLAINTLYVLFPVNGRKRNKRGKNTKSSGKGAPRKK